MTFDLMTFLSIAALVGAAIAIFVTRSKRRPTCKDMADYVDNHHM